MKVMSASFRKLIRGLKDAGRDTQMPCHTQQPKGAAGSSSRRRLSQETPLPAALFPGHFSQHLRSCLCTANTHPPWVGDP